MKNSPFALLSMSLLALAAGTAIAATPAAPAASAPAGATETLPSGVVVKHTQVGKGDSPAAADTVQVHYRGTLTDGTEFDSSYKRNQPASFPLRGVIPCWTEGLQKMKVGGKARLVCPSAIAYGERGSPPSIPPGAALIFEVELIDIIKTPPPAPAPAPGAPPVVAPTAPPTPTH